VEVVTLGEGSVRAQAAVSHGRRRVGSVKPSDAGWKFPTSQRQRSWLPPPPPPHPPPPPPPPLPPPPPPPRRLREQRRMFRAGDGAVRRARPRAVDAVRESRLPSSSTEA